jgi:hypothetical protein
MGPKARWSGRCRGIPDAEVDEPEPPIETPQPTPTPTPQPDEDEEMKYVKGMPVGVLVDEIANGEGIAIEPNRADDPAKQRKLEEKDAQRWRETLERAGVGRK